MKNLISEKLNNLSVEMLFTVLKELAPQTTAEADIVFNTGIDVLAKKISETEFIAKMEILEGLI